jgi:hypothetical protein
MSRTQTQDFAMNNPNYANLSSFSVAVFLAVPGRAAAETNAAASALLPVAEISLCHFGRDWAAEIGRSGIRMKKK